MSIMAHFKKDLVYQMFHQESQEYQENGMYSLRFFIDRKPIIVTVDDRFKVDPASKQHAFAELISRGDGKREIWPLLVEKAYAKLHNGYANI